MDQIKKHQLCDLMRRVAKKAAQFRHKGHIQKAVKEDERIENLYARAKREGVSEDHLIVAEEEGRASARH